MPMSENKYYILEDLEVQHNISFHKKFSDFPLAPESGKKL